MQALPRVNRSPLGVEAMRPWCLVLLVAFALFAPLAGALGAEVYQPIAPSMGAGGCSMSALPMGNVAMEDCCCAIPVALAPTATGTCCTAPVKQVPIEAPRLVDNCNCESSPQAPHSPRSGARTLATPPASDPSSTLVELMVAASHQPSSPQYWTSAPSPEVCGKAPSPNSLAPTRIGDFCISGVNRVGVLRGQATRLALLATLRI